MDRFYIAVRADLKPGQQMAQAVHAGIDFTQQHPTVASDWHTLSNYLVIVNVADEKELQQLALSAAECGIVHSVMIEPDLNFEVTAVALQPGPQARALCSQFPLALRAG